MERNIPDELRHVAAKRRNMHGNNPDSNLMVDAASLIETIMQELEEAQKPAKKTTTPTKKASS